MPSLCVEDCLTLDIHRLVSGALGANASQSSGIWQWSSAGDVIASAGFSVERTDFEFCTLRLFYAVNGKRIDDAIGLRAELCRFGGLRWYALCPTTRRMVAKLYRPPGARCFRARQAWRLAYRSQNVSAGLSRLCFRRDRYLLRKLESLEPFTPAKPKGMRWKTYDRHIARLDRLHRAMDATLICCMGAAIK